MGRPRPTRPTARFGLALLMLAVVAGCGAVPDHPARARAGSTDPAVPPPTFRSVRSHRSVALPVRLRIPAVRIDAPLQQVGLAPDGTIAAPTGWQVAAWYTGSARPGQEDPAVVVGHVDSRSGPAVFFRLPELRAGAEVDVDRADGTTVRFRVTGQRRVPKDDFPADVYSPTLHASLLLITCGGDFDASTGHYRDNVLVFATPG